MIQGQDYKVLQPLIWWLSWCWQITISRTINGKRIDKGPNKTRKTISITAPKQYQNCFFPQSISLGVFQKKPTENLKFFGASSEARNARASPPGNPDGATNDKSNHQPWQINKHHITQCFFPKKIHIRFTCCWWTPAPSNCWCPK